MNVFEIVMIGVGLSMDAFAMSIGNAMVHRRQRTLLFEMAALFGLFQGLMPLLGWLAGGAFSELLERLGGILVFLILGFIGYRMVKSGLCCDEECPLPAALTHKLLFIQAIATSIDAFAVGVGLRAAQTPIVAASGIIALTTFLLSLAAVLLGQRCGELLGKRAEVLGGAILILLGIKALF